MKRIDTRHYALSASIWYAAMNVDNDGCIPTLTTAHHYAGNIIAPRQGFREVGVLYCYESD